MVKINPNFNQLPGHYLFSEIARRVHQYQDEHPGADVISLGIGDVTRPLASPVIQALHQAAEDQSNAETFHGYGPEQGYAFLREGIVKRYQEEYGVSIRPDEVFIGDGAKSDIGNIGDLFSPDAKVAVCDPVYPVYVDTNVMAGRAGEYLGEGRWSRLISLPCTEANQFCPEIPGPDDPVPDLIYHCFPNNPTGATVTAKALRAWVEYALEHGSVILYDAAYEAFITEDLPRSIFEIEGARACAIEFCSFSKLAGFTGMRLGYTIIPHELKVDNVAINPMWNRRQSTKFNGASYVVQRAGEAVLSDEGQRAIQANIRYYLNNARTIRQGLEALGLTVYGGINAPYIWLKTPGRIRSWDFFDHVLNTAQVVVTPGSGFGPNGEGFIRFSAFGSHERIQTAMERLARPGCVRQLKTRTI